MEQVEGWPSTLATDGKGRFCVLGLSIHADVCQLGGVGQKEGHLHLYVHGARIPSQFLLHASDS